MPILKYIKRFYFLPVIYSIILLSCKQKNNNSTSVALLPNGKKLLDTYDSAMQLYYKEVVGSDTLMDGGITCYGEDDSMRYFYLRKGNEMHLLNQSTLYQSPWSLGIFEEEFPDFFLVRIDNGNSSPVSFQVFNKKDGSNRMGVDISAISMAYLKDSLFLLRYNHIDEMTPDSLVLFNAMTRKEKAFPLPEKLPEACEIQIDSLNNRKMILSFDSYYGEPFEKKKEYKRL